MIINVITCDHCLSSAHQPYLFVNNDIKLFGPINQRSGNNHQNFNIYKLKYLKQINIYI